MAHKVEFRLRIEGPDFQSEGPVPPRLTLGQRILKDPHVSERHAELQHDGIKCRITDLNSTHGTFLNGRKLDANTATLLNDGDIIEIGPYKLIFSQVGAGSSGAEDPDEGSPVNELSLAADDQGDTNLLAESDEPPLEPATDSISNGNNGFYTDGESLPPVEPPIALALPPLPVDPELVRYGLSIYGRRLLSYLPEIYHLPHLHGVYTTRVLPETFIPRFLGIIDAILTPIEWNIDNFDLFLNPGTTPSDFLPWLASWYQISFEPTWDDDRRRTFLKEAYWLFAWRGTKKALSRVLEIYTGVKPEIEEPETDELGDTFTVTIHAPPDQTVDRQIVEQLIEINKPAHTQHQLTILYEGDG